MNIWYCGKRCGHIYRNLVPLSPRSGSRVKTISLSLKPGRKNASDRLFSPLAWPGIEKTSGVCGGDARIAGTRIPVRLLVAYRRDGASHSDLLEAYADLTESDLGNVWVYAENHSEEIEAAIALNE